MRCTQGLFLLMHNSLESTFATIKLMKRKMFAASVTVIVVIVALAIAYIYVPKEYIPYLLGQRGSVLQDKSNSASSANVATACRITSLTAEPQSVVKGGAATISWATRNCRLAYLVGNDGVNQAIQISSGLQGSTTYGPIYRNTTINLFASVPEACPTWGCGDEAARNDFRQLTITVQ